MEAVDALEFAAVGEAAGEVEGAGVFGFSVFADGVVVFEREADGVHELVAAAAGGVVTVLGEAPLDPDCEAFGRAPGVDGIAGDYIGLPPGWTDKGPAAPAR